MRGERRAGAFAVSGKHVDDAVGESGFIDEFAETQPGQRRLLGELQHDGAAAGQGGASFQAAISSGKFQGMICATTPIGSRSV